MATHRDRAGDEPTAPKVVKLATATRLPILRVDGTDQFWGPDAAAEAVLSELGVPWEGRVVPIEAIDRSGSLAAQVRTVKLDGSRLETYVEGMRRLDTFPAIVVAKRADGRLLTINGNHRVEAAVMANRLMVGAYVCEVPDAGRRIILSVAVNARNGLSVNREEVISSAVWFIDTMGWDYAMAAAQFRLPEETIRAAIRLRRASDQLRAAGVDPEMLKPTYVRLIGRLRNVVAVRAVARLQANAELPRDALSKLIGEIEAAPSEAAQVAVVAAWEARPDIETRIEQRRGGRKPMPTLLRRRGSLLRALSQATTAVAGATCLEHVGLDTADYRHVMAQVQTLTRTLTTIGANRLDARSGPTPPSAS